MMTSQIRYLTHPQVNIEPAVPVPSWGLSEVGRTRTQTLANAGSLAGTTQIVCSGERKAMETAGIIAAKLNVTVEVREAMHENDRSATGFLAPDEFETVANRFFAQPLVSIRGWERAIDAQLRIVREVELVRATFSSSGTATSAHCCSVTTRVSRSIEPMINPPAAVITSRWSRTGGACCIHGAGWNACWRRPRS
jgi:broad specificity phosphatase PhoE